MSSPWIRVFHRGTDERRVLDTWKDFFGNPQGGTLGLFNAIQTIGGLVALPIAPYLADRIGRRYTIVIGCIRELSLVVTLVLEGRATNTF